MRLAPCASAPMRLWAQDALGVLVVELLQNLIRQAKTVDSPAALRRYGRGRVVEVLVLGLEEPEIDPIQGITERLLRCVPPARHGVGAEEHAILVLVEEFLRCPRLTSELAY